MFADATALRYYRYLRLPHRTSKLIALAYSALFLVSVAPGAAAQYLWSGKAAALNYVLGHAMALLLCPLAVFIAAPHMGLRRSLNAALFLLIPGLPVEYVALLVGRVGGLMYAVAPFLGFLVLKGLARGPRILVPSLAYPCLSSLLFSALADPWSAAALAVRLGVCCLSFLLSTLIAHAVNNTGGLDVFALSSAWTRYLFANDGEELEEFFDSMGVNVEASVRVLTLARDGDTVAVVVSPLHFGPFRTLGSSLLPYHIEGELERRRLRALVVRGAGSHELDLTKARYSEAVAKLVAEAVASHAIGRAASRLTVYEPFRVAYGPYEAFVMQVGGTSFVAVVSPAAGNDDIPGEVQALAEKLGRGVGLDDAVVVDTHSVEGPPSSDLELYRGLLLEALSRKRRACEKVAAGYGEATVGEPPRGLCRDKVKALVLGCDGRAYALIYLYGNNAQKGVRSKLRELAISLGLADAEVFTPDDHACTCSTFDAPYYSVEASEALLEAVRKALLGALRDLREAEASVLRVPLKARVCGPRIFELLSLAKAVSERTVKAVKRALAALYSCSVALLVALAAALG